jgi:hypothetical protein
MAAEEGGGPLLQAARFRLFPGELLLGNQSPHFELDPNEVGVVRVAKGANFSSLGKNNGRNLSMLVVVSLPAEENSGDSKSGLFVLS